MGEEQIEFEMSRSNSVGEAQYDAVSGPRSASGHVSSQGPSGNVFSNSESLRSVMRNAEKNAIAMALQKTNWNRKAAARMLKVSYRTVLYKIEHYNMIPSDSYPLPRPNQVDAGRQDFASAIGRERDGTGDR